MSYGTAIGKAIDRESNYPDSNPKDKSFAKSKRRHALKEIDRKWSKAKALHNKIHEEHPVTKAFKTYGDEGKKSIGSLESRLDKYTKFKRQ